MASLSLQSVCFAYHPSTQILDAVSFSADPCALFSIVGPSGSGKTTLLKTIAGLLSPQAGRIYLGDERICAQAPEHRPVVMVFQNYVLFPYLNVFDNVAFGLKMQGIPQRERKSQVLPMLERLGLSSLVAKSPLELSSGQQQRVALARALVLKPKILLLDEPFANLDPHLRMGVSDLIREITEEFRMIVLMVTHGIREALMLSHKIAVFSEGRIIQCDSPEEILQHPNNALVARLFGNENVLPCILEGTLARSEYGNIEVPKPIDKKTKVQVACRPEHGSIFKTRQPRLKNQLPAKLTSIYRGETAFYYTLALGPHIWKISCLEALPLQSGQDVFLHIPSSKAWYFMDE